MFIELKEGALVGKIYEVLVAERTSSVWNWYLVNFGEDLNIINNHDEYSDMRGATCGVVPEKIFYVQDASYFEHTGSFSETQFRWIKSDLTIDIVVTNKEAKRFLKR